VFVQYPLIKDQRSVCHLLYPRSRLCACMRMYVHTSHIILYHTVKCVMNERGIRIDIVTLHMIIVIHTFRSHSHSHVYFHSHSHAHDYSHAYFRFHLHSIRAIRTVPYHVVTWVRCCMCPSGSSRWAATRSPWATPSAPGPWAPPTGCWTPWSRASPRTSSPCTSTTPTDRCVCVCVCARCDG
jgi:hypothetical protein